MVFGLVKLSFADFFTFNPVTVITVVVSESICFVEHVVAPRNS